MLYLALWWICWTDPPVSETNWQSLDSGRFQICPVEGITSPTGIRLINNEWFLTADLLEAKPGLFRFNRDHTGTLKATRVFTMSELDLRGLAQRQDGSIYLVAANCFSPHQEDWQSLLIDIDLSAGQKGESAPLGPSNRCFDGRPECGLTAVVFLAHDRIMALRSADHPSLILMEFKDSSWHLISQRVLFVDKRMGYPVDFNIFDGQLVILFKDRWLLATASLEEASKTTSRSLHLETVFDFSHMKSELTTSGRQMGYRGLAEGFEIGPNGDLLVILNSRGYQFIKSPDDILDRRPKLLTFSSVPQFSGGGEE